VLVNGDDGADTSRSSCEPRDGTRRALGLVMHAIAFATKRTFQGFLRITRKPLASLGLTAARYDLMTLLPMERRPGDWTRAKRQSDLWRALGVTPGVVSRMLDGLEERGLVRRARPEWRYEDRRQRYVSLTELGRACLCKVRRWMQRGLARIVLHAICYGKHDDPDVQFQNMDSLESYLSVLRQHFGDRATLYYPWGHPDD
jgi:DNA-binding MarR family transcriptional regulator